MKMNLGTLPLVTLCLVLLGLLMPQQSNAAQTNATQDTGESQSGYDKLPEFGGPESVSRQLKQADEEREALYKFNGLQRNLKPYFDWKRRIHNEYGVALGFQLYGLYQQASDSLAGRDDDAAGYIFRFLGN